MCIDVPVSRLILGFHRYYGLVCHTDGERLCDKVHQIKNSTLVNPRCVHVKASFVLFNENKNSVTGSVVLLTYPCWMSSFSFATFLSSITVRDKTQAEIRSQHRPAGAAVPHD